METETAVFASMALGVVVFLALSALAWVGDRLRRPKARRQIRQGLTPKRCSSA